MNPTIGSDELIHDYVVRWSEASPDGDAVRYDERSWTWRQWRDRIDRLAGHLDAEGIGKGDRVAFLGRNSPACLELLFAAASRGAVTVVLNWRLAEDELAYALDDSGVTILFADEEFVLVAAAAGRRSPTLRDTVAVDAEDGYERILRSSSAVAATAVDPESPALVIYSSGTTGRPKGVVLSHRAVTAHTRNVGESFPFSPGDANLVAMPFFHVGGICYALFGIHAGAPSIVLRTPDVDSLVGAMNGGATHAFLVPPVIRTLLDAGAAAVDAVARLKILGYGASPTPAALLREALRAWPDVGFVQVYGQTELSGVIATLKPADHRDPRRAHLLTAAGALVPGAEVRVIDVATGEDIAPGGDGELWFRSAQAMTGYLNRPDATAETITDGWVHTGDIGHVDDEGYVYCGDRLKDMIVTGGENVYGPEVERVLLEHPAVADVAVIGVPDPHWVEAVKAIVVLTEPAEEADVIAFCRRYLAAYKCPRSIDVVDDLPRNASGKLLKKDLRAPYLQDADA